VPAERAEPAPFVLDRQSQRLEPLSCVTAVLRNQTSVWSGGGAGICAKVHRQEGAVSEEKRQLIRSSHPQAADLC
jgi:hypothetical protein